MARAAWRLESPTETPAEFLRRGIVPSRCFAVGSLPSSCVCSSSHDSGSFCLRIFHNSFCWALLGGPSTLLFLIFCTSAAQGRLDRAVQFLALDFTLPKEANLCQAAFCCCSCRKIGSDEVNNFLPIPLYASRLFQSTKPLLSSCHSPEHPALNSVLTVNVWSKGHSGRIPECASGHPGTGTKHRDTTGTSRTPSQPHSMDELILPPPPTLWICGLVPEGKRAVPSISNLCTELGVIRLLLDREKQGKLSCLCVKMWKHQTRRGFCSSDNHKHLKHFHS